MQPTSSVNNFFGIKVSKTGIPVNQATDNQLIYKNDFSTQTWYGASGIAMVLGQLATGGYGISIPTTVGTLNFGTLPDTNLGMNSVDSSGFTLFEMTGATWYWYDKSTGKNNIQLGLLPDGTYGLAITKSGYNVSDAIT